LLELFQKTRGLCSVVRYVFDRWTSIVSGPDDMTDPTLLGDQANLFSSLLAEYPSAFPVEKAESVRRELRKLIEKAVRLCVASVRPQADRLRDVIQRVVEYVAILRLGNGRIILIELPVGNSIPVKLTCSRIRRDIGREPIVLRASFPRNDKPKEGATRKQLLKKVLSEFAFRPNDLVIFIDEWVTGSNFYAILEIIDKALSEMESVFLLPVGLMTVESTTHPRYEEGFSRLHDRVLGRLGIAAGSFRYIFPPIHSRFPKSDYFFWGEHDRTAGYRKMQILGSIFSTLDKAIETLRSDEEVLFLAKFYYLQTIAQQLKSNWTSKAISAAAVLDRTHTKEFFERSYVDYQACKKELECVDHPSNLGVAADGKAAMDDVLAGLLERVRNRDARLCVNLGVIFLNNSLDIDPEDRYYFSTHAAVIEDLQGDARHLHECWMAELDG
jgi:hypothetical protein